MDIAKRVNKLYQELQLSKQKIEFLIIKKDEDNPELKKNVTQILLVI